MTDKEAGIEASAISLLTRAVEMDTQRQFTQALVCYQEGIQLLMDVLKSRYPCVDIVILPQASQSCT